MKNNIIKLHNREDNSVILVNFDDVVIVDTAFQNDKVFSMIYVEVYRDDMDHYFEVNETPEKIFAAYPDMAKYFIRVHNKENNLTVYVKYNVIHIVDTVRCDESTACSQIYMNENSIEPFTVNETPEKIYTMIEEKYKTVPNNEQ